MFSIPDRYLKLFEVLVVCVCVCVCVVLVTLLPKTDIFHNHSEVKKATDVGFFACELVAFDVVYARQVFERRLRS